MESFEAENTAYLPLSIICNSYCIACQSKQTHLITVNGNFYKRSTPSNSEGTSLDFWYRCLACDKKDPMGSDDVEKRESERSANQKKRESIRSKLAITRCKNHTKSDQILHIWLTLLQMFVNFS